MSGVGTGEFIVTAHLPRAEAADKFVGELCLAPVEWTLGTKKYAEAKAKQWAKFFHHVAVRPVGAATFY